MKIIFSGGGTLGPVVPLLAIADTYREYDPHVQYLWIGTKNGPEKALVEQHHIPFRAIGAGKWRRYFSLLNLVDLFKFVISFFQCVRILWKEKPDLLVSAGGFVSVPLHLAAAFLTMPTWVHQQDVRLGLANKLMFPFARKITSALKEHGEKLPKGTEWIGNPSRDLSVGNIDAARRKFNLPDGAPVIFAFGGGTGSSSLNQMVLGALPQLNPKWQVIHLVGRERPKELSERAVAIFPNYHVYEFFNEEMKDAYAIADVVVGRAGFSTLTELAALSKPAIILPMIGTHQEENARLFARQGGIMMMDQTGSGLKLAQLIKDLIESEERRNELGMRLHSILPMTKPEKIIEIIKKITG